MKKIWIFFMFLLVFISTDTTYSSTFHTSALADQFSKSKITSKVGIIPLPFIKNDSLTDPRVKYYVNTLAGTTFVTDDGITYALRGKDQKTRWVLKEKFLNAHALQPEGSKLAETKISYFRGNNPAKWRSNIKAYEEVLYDEVYDHIQINLKAYGSRLEKLFIIGKGAKPEEIAVMIEGTKGLKVNEKGELEIKTGIGTVRMTKPVAYQEIDGRQIEVKVGYDLKPSAVSFKRSAYGFKVGSYNKDYPLVIDPILASTFIGGDAGDSISAIALDPAGNVYVTGTTNGSSSTPPVNFPTTPGAYQEKFDEGGETDIFISKFNPTLTTLLASTCIGGTTPCSEWSCGTNAPDYVHTIKIDASGNVYIGGETHARDFPTTEGVFDPTPSMWYSNEGFVAKFDSSLSTLIASTFINKDTFGEWSTVYSLAFASDGSVYIAGGTNGSAPVPGGYQTTSKMWEEAYVGKMNSSLTTMQAFTFIGGTGRDYANSIMLDSSGNVFIAGYSNSTDYPTTSGAYDTTFNDSYDVIISKFNSSLTTLLASTYLGGAYSDDYGNALVLDSSGNVLVAGTTYTCGWCGTNDFPTTNGAYDTSYNGAQDIFVAKLNSNLTSLLASTLLGGDHFEELNRNGVALDSKDNIYLAGSTGSSDFPTTADADYPTFNQGVRAYDVRDVFISKLSSDLTSLSYSTFVSGTSTDRAYAIALDSSGKIYFGGYTYSSDYPTTTDAYSPTCTRCGEYDYDAFVSKLEIPENLSVSVIGPTNVNPGQEVTYLLKYKNGMKVTAKDVIAVLDIPYNAEYVSSTHNGIYRFVQDKNQVFWKLGDLAADATGECAAKLIIPWGLPSGSSIILYADIGARNDVSPAIDVDAYLSYPDRSITQQTSLTTSEINTLFSQKPSVKELYDYALSIGYAYLGLTENVTLKDGTSLTRFILVDTSDSYPAFLTIVGDDSLVVKIKGSEYTLFDTDGGLIADRVNQIFKPWGTWAEEGSATLSMSGKISAPPGLKKLAKCQALCMIEKLPSWFNPFDKMKAVIDSLDCMRCGSILWASSEACLKCAGLAGEVPVLEQIADTTACLGQCLGDPNKYDCTEDIIECGQSWKAWLMGNTYTAYTTKCNNGIVAWTAIGVDCATWEKCISGCGCESSPACAEYVSKKRKKKTSTVTVAHDPNAKSVDYAGEVNPGQKLTYTIEYENTGSGTAYDVFILDELDTDLDETTLDIKNNGEYTAGSRLLSWDIGDLAPGGKGSVTFSVNVKSGVASGTEIINYATVYFPSASEETPTNAVVNIVNTVSADPKSAETTSGTPVSITLSGHGPGSLTYKITSYPLQGTISGTLPNVIYNSVNEFSGIDEFYYTVSSGTTESNPARVIIKVNPNTADTNPPTVSATSPAADAVNVHISNTPIAEDQYLPRITATFSEQLNSETVTSDSFTVDGVSGTVFYDDQSKTATFIPSVPLVNSKTYTARLSTGITDKVGNHLQSEYSWQFTTESLRNIVVTLPDNADSVNFGNVGVNSTSAEKVISISNTGSDDLALGTIRLLGTNRAEFQICGDSCSQSTLAQLDNCTVKVVFKPASTGNKSAQLNILSNDPDTPLVNVSLSGTGTTCSEWDDVIQKYQAYVQNQASWQEVIDCFNTYVKS